MKLAILSRNRKLYSTRRLVEAAQSRGHTVRVVDPLRCYMRISPGLAEIHYKGKVLEGFDAIIPRIGASITFYGTAVVRQFESMGVYTVNGSDGIGRARDKLRSMQLLSQQGIGLPTTVCADSPDDTDDLVAMLGEDVDYLIGREPESAPEVHDGQPACLMRHDPVEFIA